MARAHNRAGAIRRCLLLLVLAAVALASSGCLIITGIEAPSGPPSSTYAVTVTLEPLPLEDGEEPPDEFSRLRGVLGVRFPEEWELLSATYADSVKGSLKSSAVIADFYASLSEEQTEPLWPGLSLLPKPGYRWWAGYSAAHGMATEGPITVTLVFDQGQATGAYALDFISGVTDAEAPEDFEAEGSLWTWSAAFDRPVFTGVPAVNVPPQVSLLEGPDEYTAIGAPVRAFGAVFDPDSEAVSVTVDYGDGESEDVELGIDDLFAPPLGVQMWEWAHVWQEPGTYTVTMHADDGTSATQATATVHVGASPFADVLPGSPFFEAIVSLWNNEAVTGYPDGTFRPYEPLVRAQFAKMLTTTFLAHDEPITNLESPSFSDVVFSGDPYPYDYVEEAVEYGMMTGFADDTFHPWDGLTRIQLLRGLARSGAIWLDDPPSDYRLPFGDVPDADVKYVALAHYNGLIDGRDATRFGPYGPATRGQLAKILYRVVQREEEFFAEAGLAERLYRVAEGRSLQETVQVLEPGLPVWLRRLMVPNGGD